MQGPRSISFMHASTRTSARLRARLTRLPVVLAALVVAIGGLSGGTAAAATAAATDRLPNLVATPATDIAFGTGTELRFSTLSWNAGTGPLELRAGDVSGGTQRVWQRVYRDDGTSSDLPAGDFVWHSTHNHFHFEQYARYEIQPVGSPGGSQRTGQKTTFCVMDTTAMDLRLPGAPSSGGYSSCGNSYQGMSVGWGDRYGSSLAGQSIEMSGMTSGDYELRIVIDPQDRILESNDADNSSCVLVRIDMTRRSVTVLNAAGCDTYLGSITPSRVAVGASIAVTIKGTGFASGMSASFSGGNGAAPSISGLSIVDASTATATVSVPRRKRPGSDPVWDLRLGPATLRDAVTVCSGC
ncbi:MAG: hypothetical protein RL338_1542 [Chloroflexota bacterium]